MGSGESDAAEHFRTLTQFVIEKYKPALDALAEHDACDTCDCAPKEDDPAVEHEAPTL
jgi:hypothetical protein